MNKKDILLFYCISLMCAESELNPTHKQAESDETWQTFLATLPTDDFVEDDEIGTLDGYSISSTSTNRAPRRRFQFKNAPSENPLRIKRKTRIHTLLSSLDLLKLAHTEFKEGDTILIRTSTQQYISLSFCIGAPGEIKQSTRPGAFQFHSLVAGTAILYSSYDHPEYNLSDGTQKSMNTMITLVNKFMIKVEK